MTRRFKAVMKEMQASIVTNDCFGLVAPKRSIDEMLWTGAEEMMGLAALPTRRFAFRRDNEKLAGFMEWLQEEMDREILEVVDLGGKTVGGGVWQQQYIDAAYKRGVTRGRTELRKGGMNVPQEPIRAILAAPIHAERVALLYTRVFNELKGITDGMDQLISRSLAEGLAEGRSPDQIAQILLKRMNNVGQTLDFVDRSGRFVGGVQRARMLARTEVIRAHHLGTINTYRQAGIEGVSVQAEFLTAGDDRVCPDCEELEGQIFTLDEAEGLIPVHPLCRCVCIPYMKGWK